MKQDNKRFRKTIFYLNEDCVYGVQYKKVISNVRKIDKNYYISTIERLVLGAEQQKYIYSKEIVLLEEIKKLSDNIIILNIVDFKEQENANNKKL